MKFGKISLDPIKIAFLTSILSVVFVILDASSIYENAFPAVLFVATLASIIVQVYSRVPELYSAPEISIPVILLFGVLLGLKGLISLSGSSLELGILIVGCLAAFYFFVWRKGFQRIYLTVILLIILITGSYLLHTYDSVLLFIGFTFWGMPLVLYSIKYAQEYSGQPKTVVRNLNIGLGIVALIFFIGSAYTLVVNTNLLTTGNQAPGALLVLRLLLIGMIFLGSLSMYRQLDDKPSKVYRFYWWGATTAVSILVLASFPLLSGLSLYYGLDGKFGRLSEPIWIVFACMAGIQIILWVHKKNRRQWLAFAVGSVGGLLLSYLWTPLAYAISFDLYVPGQIMPVVNIDDSLQLGAGAGVVILIVTIFLAVYIGRPQNRIRAIAAACIAGLTVSIFVFVSSGATLSVIASQRSMYGIAFTRVGFDEVGWTSALTEAVLYIHPWVYGVLAICLLIGLLPAVLIGLTWPVRRNSTTEDRSNELSPSVPLQLFMLSIVTIILVAVFGLLDDSIENTIIGVGLKTWWEPEWIVPLTILLPTLIFVGIVAWIFLRMSSWERSPRNAVFVCLSGLILMMHGFVIWLLGSSNVFIMFVLLGVGMEMFRHGLGLWKNPEPSLQTNLMPKLDEFDALSGAIPAFLTISIAALPMLVIALGLALVPIVAIPELRQVTAPPPGGEWLLKMLENAIQITQVVTVSSLLIGFWFAYSLYLMIDLMGNPVRIGYWWGKLAPLGKKLDGYFNQVFSNKRRVIWLTLSWILVGFLLVIFVNDSHNWLTVLLFLISYIYFKLRPGWFQRISWPTYIIAGLILLVGILSTRITMLGSLVLLTGPALALIYRGLVVYGGDSRGTIFRTLFFPALGIFFSLYATYLQPITIVENGVARFKDGRWENIGAENSPLSGDKKYSFLKDSNNALWISGYYGPEALLRDDGWEKVRATTAQSPTTDKLSTFGLMLERGGNYFFVNDHTLLGIIRNDSTFRSSRPKRPRPVPNEILDDQGYLFGENAGACSSIAIDEEYECPVFAGEITSAVIDTDGWIWLGTSENGVARFHHETSSDLWNWEFQTTENSEILSDRITGMVAAGNGSILALGTLGVSVRSPDGEWTDYTSADLVISDPQTIFADTLGRVWVGSSNEVSTWDGQGWQKSSLAAPASISGFYEDGAHEIWALSTTGAWKYSGQKWLRVIDIPRDPFWQNPFGFSSFYRVEPTGSGVYKMVEDQSGNLWFGGPNGLVSYDPITEQVEYFYSSNSGLPSENVQDIQVGTDGALWVSTYTPNIAYRTELPVIGFSFMMICTLLGVIYMGYRRAPRFKALQISKRLVGQPQNLLQEVHQTFAVADTGDVLEALADQLTPERSNSGLVNTFASVAGNNHISGRDKAVRLLEDLQNSKDLHWQPQLVIFYQFIVQGIQARSISDIGSTHLTVLRSQAVENVTLTYNDSMPFELPGFVGHNIIDSLEMLSRTCQYLRKYLQVENPQDRLGFIADGLGAVERAARDAAATVNPEGYFLGEICSLWLDIIRRELDVLSGHADLRVEFRTRQVRHSEKVTLVLNVRNTGSSIANQVEVSLLPNEQIHIGEKTTCAFEYIGAGSSVVAEFIVDAPPTGDVRVSGEITWSDRIENSNRSDFADVIRFFETTGQFRRIPNPYVVGHPVKSASLFQGRDDIFDFISHNIQGTTQSHTLVLYGQRRTGKTSILYQLLGGKLGDNFIPVLVDVQEIAPGIQGMSDLFLELALRTDDALEKAGLEVEKVNEDSFSASPTRSFGRYLTGVERLLDGRKIMVMFDEFELLEEKILQGRLEPESLGYLRSLIQHRENLIFMFTGTHKLEQMSKDYWSIFFNIALHQRVSFMEKEAAVRLIREPVRETLLIDDLVIEKILSLTQGHPYFTQLICWALVNYCNKNERNYATLNDLNDVLMDIVHTGDSYFAYVWTQVSADERIVMAALAERLSPGKSAISVQEIVEEIAGAGRAGLDRTTTLKLLDGLTDLEILTSSGQDGTLYSYKVGLIGEWVKSSKPLRHLVEREP